MDISGRYLYLIICLHYLRMSTKFYFLEPELYVKLFSQLRENNRYLQITNTQLYNEMRRFQEEISSDEDEEDQKNEGRRSLSLVEKLRIKREKEKVKRAEKLRLHAEEVEEYKHRMVCLAEQREQLQSSLQERETKYELLAEEFNSVQKNFSAYKTSREEVIFETHLCVFLKDLIIYLNL